MRLTVGYPRCAGLSIERPAGAGLARAVGAGSRQMRRRARSLDLGRDVLAGAEAGIEEFHPSELVERGSVVVHTLGLPADRLFPVEPQPGKVPDDCILEFGPAAAGIDVLDPEMERAAGGIG